MAGKPYTYPEEGKKNVSKARREFSRKNLLPIPDRKKCTRCKKWKDSGEFSRVSKFIKAINGPKQYLLPTCKQCEREKHRARPREQVRANNRRAAAKISADPERAAKRREYQREWAAQKRRKMGIPVGTARVVNQKERGEKLPLEPFSNWLREFCKDTSVEEVAIRAGVEPKQIRRWISMFDRNYGEIQSISVQAVDEFFISLGMPNEMAILYEPVDVR